MTGYMAVPLLRCSHAFLFNDGEKIVTHHTTPWHQEELRLEFPLTAQAKIQYCNNNKSSLKVKLTFLILLINAIATYI